MHQLCHYCSKMTLPKLFVKCCKKKCSKFFCIDCILLKFDSLFKLDNVRPETWICYSCGQKCDCVHCDPKGLRRNNGTLLRYGGKFKCYHEKNRILLDSETNVDQAPNILNKSYEDEIKNTDPKQINGKRKFKRDLAKLENKYLNKKKALRNFKIVVTDEKDIEKERNIEKLLKTISLDVDNSII